MDMHEAADEWAWLEEIGSRRALDWVHAQNARTRAALAGLPRYGDHYARALAVLDAPDRIALAELERGLAYNFWQDGAHPRGLWRRTGIDDYAQPVPSWQILLDVDALAATEQENWLFKGASLAPAQDRALLSLSRGGGDSVVVREFDLAEGKFLEAGFTLPDAKSAVAYLDDDTVLYATDCGQGSLTRSGYPRIVKLWRRGREPDRDPVIFAGTVEDVLVAPLVFHSAQGTVAMIVRATSFFENEYHLVDAKLETLRLPLPASAELEALFQGWLIVKLREHWQPYGERFPQGALIGVCLEPQHPSSPLGEIVLLDAPGPRESLGDVRASCDALYVSRLENVQGRVLRLDRDPNGWQKSEVPLPEGGTVRIVSADRLGPNVQFLFESYLVPPTLYGYAAEGTPQPLHSLPPRFDAAGLVTEQFEARSTDGTMIPYFVTHGRGKMAPRPTILYGYGGFEVALLPSYSALAGMLWLNEGGNYVVANIRGGGEFGPAWHDAARKANRQRAFDDFAAVAQDLVVRGFCRPDQIGAMGGSNGGLLVATLMVQHPELIGAVVCQVPLTDMLAYMRIGAGASWEAEYGDPSDPQLRPIIAGYSPYQNVRSGRRYPPLLLLTATTDDRVTPAHARKLAARMQAQGHRVWFYENTDGGHAGAADHRQAAEMWALSYIWLKQQLGLPM
jgi:prolyl oligopeptidase